MRKTEIERFLSHLAVNRGVTAATENQALNAILFLCREVPHVAIGGTLDAAWSRKQERLPSVLSRPEVANLLGAMDGTNQLMAK